MYGMHVIHEAPDFVPTYTEIDESDFPPVDSCFRDIALAATEAMWEDLAADLTHEELAA